MTQIDPAGHVAAVQRATASMRYPLPPEPPRFQPTYNHYQQYTLPHPRTGRQTAFPRVTTVAGTLSDHFGLNQWSTRCKVASVMNLMRADDPVVSRRLQESGISRGEMLLSLSEAAAKGIPGPSFNALVDQVNDAAGGRDAAELGQAVHAWLEAVDISTVRPADVPPQFQPHLAAYRDVLARYALVPEPQYVERIVLNDGGEETVVGTLDRIYRVVTTGELVLGDLKTSTTLDYGWLEYAIQLALYHTARLMLSMDGTEWEPVPDLAGAAAYLIHVPSDQPERSSCVTFDMEYGWEAAQTALRVRAMRREAKNRVPYVHAIPIPNAGALRYVQARHAVQDITHPDELTSVWQEFQDVWTEDLTALGNQISGLFQ